MAVPLPLQPTVALPGWTAHRQRPIVQLIAHLRSALVVRRMTPLLPLVTQSSSAIARELLKSELKLRPLLLLLAIFRQSAGDELTLAWFSVKCLLYHAHYWF